MEEIAFSRREQMDFHKNISQSKTLEKTIRILREHVENAEVAPEKAHLTARGRKIFEDYTALIERDKQINNRALLADRVDAVAQRVRTMETSARDDLNRIRQITKKAEKRKDFKQGLKDAAPMMIGAGISGIGMYLSAGNLSAVTAAAMGCVWQGYQEYKDIKLPPHEVLLECEAILRHREIALHRLNVEIEALNSLGSKRRGEIENKGDYALKVSAEYIEEVASLMEQDLELITKTLDRSHFIDRIKRGVRSQIGALVDIAANLKATKFLKQNLEELHEDTQYFLDHSLKEVFLVGASHPDETSSGSV